MNDFTFEEQNLLFIYNGAGGGIRAGVIAALTEMRGYLEPDEDELRMRTDSALSKLGRMTDAEFAALDLFPDFETEDPAYGK